MAVTARWLSWVDGVTYVEGGEVDELNDYGVLEEKNRRTSFLGAGERGLNVSGMGGRAGSPIRKTRKKRRDDTYIFFPLHTFFSTGHNRGLVYYI